MPEIKKFLSKFNKEERKIIIILIEKITSFNWRNLDIKKLKGYPNIFRARRSKIRIIFIKNEKRVFILTIERRSENTYKF